MGLPGLWLFLARIAASIFLAVGSAWLANKTVHRPGLRRNRDPVAVCHNCRTCLRRSTRLTALIESPQVCSLNPTCEQRSV